MPVYSEYPKCKKVADEPKLALDCLYFCWSRDKDGENPDLPKCLHKLCSDKDDVCPGGVSRKQRGLGSPAILIDTVSE